MHRARIASTHAKKAWYARCLEEKKPRQKKIKLKGPTRMGGTTTVIPNL